MGKCFLSGYGPCGGKLSGEHYISKTVLKAIGSGSVQVGGLPWQPSQTLQRIGIGSLTANVLCRDHNRGLSDLDKAAGHLFRTLDAADKRPADLPTVTVSDGDQIERWFIKVLCGLAAGLGFNDATIPDAWKVALTGGSWPALWGLYLPAPAGPQVLANEFSLETLIKAGTKTVAAAKFRVAGVHFTLLLGRPDEPTAWGTPRPHRVAFRNADHEKLVEFKWSNATGGDVVYTKIGTTKARPPQWGDWIE